MCRWNNSNCVALSRSSSPEPKNVNRKMNTYINKKKKTFQIPKNYLLSSLNLSFNEMQTWVVSSFSQRGIALKRQNGKI